MMRVFESHLIGNFTHGLGRIGKTFLNFLDNGELDILLSRFPRFLLYQIPKIIRRKIKHKKQQKVNRKKPEHPTRNNHSTNLQTG